MVGNRRVRRLNAADEMALKRLAIQIAAQLPDDMDHAKVVLDMIRELVGGFLGTPSGSCYDKPPIVLVKS